MLKKAIFILLFSLSSIYIYAQSGWTREKKDYFLQLDYSFYQSNDFANLKGDVIKTTTFHQNSLSFYSEYGISNRFALHFFIPLIKQNYYENTNRINGVGDVRIELKYAIHKKQIPISISVAPEIPTGKADNFATNLQNPLEKINLPTGDGEFNVWTTLAISHSFKNTKIYSNIYTAFNLRSNYKNRNFQNQFKAGAEIGNKFFNKLYLNGKLIIQEGVGSDPIFSDFIRGDGTTYTAISTGVYHEVYKNIGLSAQYFTFNNSIIKVKNLYKSNSFSFGIVLKNN